MPRMSTAVFITIWLVVVATGDNVLNVNDEPKVQGKYSTNDVLFQVEQS